MNRNYELVVVLDPDVSTEEQENLLAKIKKTISDGEGKISTLKDWGKKEFTFPIAKKRSGFYHVLNFSFPVSSTSSLKQRLNLEEKIVRYLLITNEGRVKPVADNKAKTK